MTFANDRPERKPRRFLLLVGLVLTISLTVVSAVSADSWGCLGDLFGGDNQTTTYAPPFNPASTTVAQSNPTLPTTTYANYACAMPVTQATVYKPEVDYRWTYSRIKRTEYEPVTAVDPCTGCMTTYYRPEEKKSLLPWLHREKVVRYKPTTVNLAGARYAPTCSTVCTPVSSVCNPCGSAVGSGTTVSSGCTSCSSGAPVSSTVTGTTTVVSPSSSGSGITPTPDPASSTPSLNNSSQSTYGSPYNAQRPTTEAPAESEPQVHASPSPEAESSRENDSQASPTKSNHSSSHDRVPPIPDTQRNNMPPLVQPERKTTDSRSTGSPYQTAVYRQTKTTDEAAHPVAHRQTTSSTERRQDELARRAAQQKHLWHAPGEAR